MTIWIVAFTGGDMNGLRLDSRSPNPDERYLIDQIVGLDEGRSIRRTVPMLSVLQGWVEEAKKDSDTLQIIGKLHIYEYTPVERVVKKHFTEVSVRCRIIDNATGGTIPYEPEPFRLVFEGGDVDGQIIESETEDGTEKMLVEMFMSTTGGIVGHGWQGLSVSSFLQNRTSEVLRATKKYCDEGGQVTKLHGYYIVGRSINEGVHDIHVRYEAIDKPTQKSDLPKPKNPY